VQHKCGGIGEVDWIYNQKVISGVGFILTVGGQDSVLLTCFRSEGGRWRIPPK
jgi:hypothetical protein